MTPCPFCDNPCDVDLQHWPDINLVPCCDAAAEDWATVQEWFINAHAREIEYEMTAFSDLKLRTEVVQGKRQDGRSWQRWVFDRIDAEHSHHSAPHGWRFGVVAWRDNVPVGVASVGRPVGRGWDHTAVVEVNRACVWGDAPLRYNASTALYAAARREARRRGFKQIVTYTLASEGAGSLKAAGWTVSHPVKGRDWNQRNDNAQRQNAECQSQDKLCWSIAA